MSSILFLFEIIAFVIVAYWAYDNDKAGVDSGGKGLLKMRTLASRVSAAAAKNTPKWKRTLAEPSELADDPILRRARPKWKRTLRPRS